MTTAQSLTTRYSVMSRGHTQSTGGQTPWMSLSGPPFHIHNMTSENILKHICGSTLTGILKLLFLGGKLGKLKIALFRPQSQSSGHLSDCPILWVIHPDWSGQSIEAASTQRKHVHKPRASARWRVSPTACLGSRRRSLQIKWARRTFQIFLFN